MTTVSKRWAFRMVMVVLLVLAICIGFAGTALGESTGDETTIVKADVKWVDQNDFAGVRPETVTLKLKADDVLYDGDGSPVTLPHTSGSYRAEWTDLPKYKMEGGELVEIVYTVTQDQLPLYYNTTITPNQYTGVFVATNQLIYYTYSPYIDWQDSSDAASMRPESVTIQVYADGVRYTGNNNEFEITGSTLDTRWRSSPSTYYYPSVDASGNNIAYTFKQADLPASYTANTETSTNGRFSDVLKTIPVAMSLIWDDNSNASGLRPSNSDYSLTALLDGSAWPLGELKYNYSYASTTEVSTRTILVPKTNADGSETYTEADYTFTQNGVPGWYTETQNEWSSGVYYLKNELAALVTYTATVEWDDDSNANSTRPNSVLLTLYANGAESPFGTSCVEVSQAGDTWTCEWSGLPPVDEEGNAITYTVRQNTLPIYVTEYTDTATQTTIDNTVQDSWTYYVDLRWDTDVVSERYDTKAVTTNPTALSRKYILTVATNSAEYDIGNLEIRLPYYLWSYRDSTTAGPKPTDIGVPPAPHVSTQSSFNYTIDDKGTANVDDDELVFTNCKKVNAGTNQTLSVIYGDILPSNTVDLSSADLTAVASGLSTVQVANGQTDPEIKSFPTITYQLDTGVQVTSLGKSFYRDMYTWETAYGSKPTDFNENNYVRYRVSIRTSGNQPYDIVFYDTPAEDGKVIYADGHAITEDSGTYSWTISNRNGNFTDNYIYVVVAYPRPESAGNPTEEQTAYTTTYHNSLRAVTEVRDEHPGHGTDADMNDLSERTSMNTHVWTDYVFNYTGSVYMTYKYMYGDNYSTTLDYDADITNNNAQVYGYVYGYDFTGYSFELFDDALYANVTGKTKWDDYVRLDADDYEIDRLYVQVYSYDLDRETGTETVVYQPYDEPVTIWAQKGKDGSWEKIGELSERYYTIIQNDVFKDQGYTGVRIVAPEGLKDKTYFQLRPYYSLKHTSPKFQAWLDADPQATINILNFSGFKLYVEQPDGTYAWVNKLNEPLTDAEAGVALSDEDYAENDGYYFRKYYEFSFPPIAGRSVANKITYQYSNDSINSKVNVRFNITAGSCLPYIEALPEVAYDTLSIDEGVFYDLLPFAYYWNEDEALEVIGPDQSTDVMVTNVESIDNWRGTGRQMLIIHVESLADPGDNLGSRLKKIYNPSYYGLFGYSSTQMKVTGYSVAFTASIDWADLRLNKQGTNLMAFQAADARTLTGNSVPKTDTGTVNTAFSTVLGNDGNSAFYDVNGDGETEARDTLYATSAVNPDVAGAVEIGIKKLVKGLGFQYNEHDQADLEGDYKYRIYLSTSDGVVTSDLILYDIFEDAENTGGNTGEDPGWKGSLKEINTIAAERQGVDPVVYYSIQAGLDYNDPDDMDLSDGTIWTTTAPTDLDTVTAVAFDLSKKEDGSAFELVDMSTINVEITMTAPDALQPQPLAYNQPAYHCFFLADTSSTADEMHNIGSRVTVELIDLQDVSFVKLGETEAGGVEPIENVLFSLYQCGESDDDPHTHHGTPGTAGSCWGEIPVQTAKSNEFGVVTFTDLNTGEYAIVETRVNKPHEMVSGWWLVSVDASEGTTSGITTGSGEVDMVENEGYAPYLTLTDPLATIDLTLTKVWSGDTNYGIRPDSVTAKINRNDTLYKTVELKAEDSWTATVKDLFKYDETGAEYDYTVDEIETPGYESVVTENSAGTSFTITNTANRMLKISKTVVNGDTDKKFSFAVTLLDSEADPLAGTFPVWTEGPGDTITKVNLTTDAEGKLTVKLAHNQSVKILDLPTGTKYSIIEAEEDGYTATVTSGSVTGTLSSGFRAVVCRNTYAASGKLSLTATKKVNGATPTSFEVYSFLLKNGADTPAVTQTKQNLLGTITFDDLNYSISDAGKTYTYTIRETTAAGNGLTPDSNVYTVTVEIEDNGDGTLDVTHSIKCGEIVTTAIIFTNKLVGDLKVTKTISGSSPSTTDAFDFTVTLGNDTVNGTYGGMTFTDSVATFKLKNGESKTASNLPYNIAYTVKEKSDVRYATTVNGTEASSVSGNLGKTNITAAFVNKRVTTSLAVTKSWEGGSGAVTLTIYADGEAMNPQPAVTMESNVYTFSNLLKHKENGDVIVYTVKETPVTGYMTIYQNVDPHEDETGLAYDGATIINRATTGFSVVKSWKGGSGGITLTLYANGAALDPQPTCTRNGNIYTYSNLRKFDDAGDEIVYTAKETAIYGFVTTYANIAPHTEETACVYNGGTITNRAVIDFSVIKEWQDSDSTEYIILTLYANGEILDPQPSYTRSGSTYTYADLTKFDDNGSAIEYAAKEKYMDGFMTIYRNVAPYDEETSYIYNGGTIINRAVTQIAVRKIWKGLGSNETPPEITFTLYCDGHVVNRKPFLDDDGWYHFINLPISTAPYYVIETPVSGYSAKYENAGLNAEETECVYNGGVITNTKIPEIPPTGDAYQNGLYLLLLVVSLMSIGLAVRYYIIRRKFK